MRRASLTLLMFITASCSDPAKPSPRHSTLTRPPATGPTTAAATTQPVAETDLAIAQQAERRFHSACDAWAWAADRGGPTADAETAMGEAYGTFMEHVLNTNYVPCQAALLPETISRAGLITLPDQSRWSYVAGKGQTGFMVGMMQRCPWTATDLPGEGLGVVVGIESEASRSQFAVGRGAWVAADTLRVPYTLGPLSGTLSVHPRVGEWLVVPDRGSINHGWWNVDLPSAATRPAR